jgi:hypothetical protein
MYPVCLVVLVLGRKSLFTLSKVSAIINFEPSKGLLTEGCLMSVFTKVAVGQLAPRVLDPLDLKMEAEDIYKYELPSEFGGGPGYVLTSTKASDRESHRINTKYWNTLGKIDSGMIKDRQQLYADMHRTISLARSRHPTPAPTPGKIKTAYEASVEFVKQASASASTDESARIVSMLRGGVVGSGLAGIGKQLLRGKATLGINQLGGAGLGAALGDLAAGTGKKKAGGAEKQASDEKKDGKGVGASALKGAAIGAGTAGAAGAAGGAGAAHLMNKALNNIRAGVTPGLPEAKISLPRAAGKIGIRAAGAGALGGAGIGALISALRKKEKAKKA